MAEYNETQNAIYSTLEATAAGIKATKDFGLHRNLEMHLSTLKEFINKGKDEGLDKETLSKYETILENSKEAILL